MRNIWLCCRYSVDTDAGTVSVTSTLTTNAGLWQYCTRTTYNADSSRDCTSISDIGMYVIYSDIIPHLHNSFLIQCDVTRSLNRYENPEQTAYWPRAYNSVSTVAVYWPMQILCFVYIGRLVQRASYDTCDRFFYSWNILLVFKRFFLNVYV